MLAVASKPSAAGSSPSRPLPLESGEFMHSREFLGRLPVAPLLAGDTAKVLAALTGAAG
jgi:hypothetical protein